MRRKKLYEVAIEYGIPSRFLRDRLPARVCKCSSSPVEHEDLSLVKCLAMMLKWEMDIYTALLANKHARDNATTDAAYPYQLFLDKQYHGAQEEANNEW